MKRLPAVAGSFYESDPKKLKMQIEWSFRHNIGPRDIPKQTYEKKKRDNLFLSCPMLDIFIAAPWQLTHIIIWFQKVGQML
jgi:Predicted dioxygenase